MAEKPKVECYWDADDRERGWGDPSDFIDTDGSVREVEHVAVVNVTFEAMLPAAEDSDTDQEFYVIEDTREKAEAKIAAEIARRSTTPPKDAK